MTFSIMALESVMLSVVYAMSFMLNVANKHILLSVINLSVVLLNVIASSCIVLLALPESIRLGWK
jgi:hypothetical protein